MLQLTPHTLVLLLCFFISATGISATQASDVSEALFAKHRGSVFQIRLVDSGSNQKKSLGSGFKVSANGLVATNYHVISDSVYEKDHYRIEAVDDQNIHHTMTLRAIDVVHDLALLEFDQANPNTPSQHPSLAINIDAMQQGQNVFSLGNPHDIGMMIVAGEYNGPVKDSRFKRMIFSGNINSGMSGGPAINSNGEIIGINVASSGDGIGYLVPAVYLSQLLEEFSQQSQQTLSAVAGTQLLADQENFYSSVLASAWKTQTFAELTLPEELHASIKCWGDSEETKNRRYDASTMRCSNRMDDLFILDDKYIGLIEYRYSWSKQLDLNRFQLYSLAEQKNDFGSNFFSDYEDSWNKHEVTPYSCKTSFIESGGGTWRTIYCVRRYKIFPGLFDMGLLMTSVDHNDRTLSIKLTAAGISEKNAAGLTEKFIRSVAWKK